MSKCCIILTYNILSLVAKGIILTSSIYDILHTRVDSPYNYLIFPHPFDAILPYLFRLHQTIIILSPPTSFSIVSTTPNNPNIRLPIPGEPNILITSALPYVNNVPHLGNIIGSVLSGDVYSRYLDLVGINKLYVCGTDEYGTATETKALELGVSEKELCDKYHKLHKGIYDWFDIKFDHFSRTTTDNQTAIAQDIFNKCDANGYITEKTVTQLYCGQCSRFLADRYVAGICPYPECGYTDAKGDQCDKCGKVYEAVELRDPRCLVCKSSPGPKESTHLYLDLPNNDLHSKLTTWVNKTKENWTDNSVGVTESWLRELQPRCITRDLKWGTPVPKPGFTDKVFYVWFDAPIGYISITSGYTLDDVPSGQHVYEQWWKNPDNVDLVQFMGKDNITFHTIIFPSTLLATGDKWTMLKRLSTTEYLNYEGTKFSKTRGTGVFGDQVQETGIPVEIWRYYLLANRPENNDSMFQWEDFALTVNGELPNTLGNLVQRSLSFLASKFDNKIGSIEDIIAQPTDAEILLTNTISKYIVEYVQRLENIKIRDSLYIAMRIAEAGNLYMQTVKPWETMKDDIKKAHGQLSIIVQVLYLLSIVFEPFMPSFSRKLLTLLQLPEALPYGILKDVTSWPLLELLTLSPCNTTGIRHKLFPLALFNNNDDNKILSINKPEILFKKIEPTVIEELRQRYQGKSNTNASSNQQGTVDWPATTRVGLIKNAIIHPTNNKSVVLEIDVGEKDVDTGAVKYRSIVSGLAEQYTLDELINRHVIVMCNLKPSKFQGILSEGMLLTGLNVTAAGTRIELLSIDNIDNTILPGDLVLPLVGKHTPTKNFDPKKKLSSLEFAVGENGVVTALSGSPFVVHGKDKQIIAPNVAPGSKIA